MTVPLLIALLLGSPIPALGITTPAPGTPTPVLGTPPPPSEAAESAPDALYREMDLAGILQSSVFAAAYRSAKRHGLKIRMLAIADMTQPSTRRRLYILDMRAKKLVLRTWVAHGSNSGGLMAERFSNRDGSHQTSLGLYRVGSRIVSRKHGPALLLQGLDKGKNDEARAREVIIHGADYVSPQFIAAHGRLGRSWGCPAVPTAEMARVIDLLADGGLLYVYGE